MNNCSLFGYKPTNLQFLDLLSVQWDTNLVEDEKVRDSMLELILTELKKTRRLMAELLVRPMEQRRKNHFYSAVLRAEALHVLHQNQIKNLKLWRTNKFNSPEEQNETLNHLLISVNAIANAMGTTG